MGININLIEPQLKKDEVIIDSTKNIIEELEPKVDNISIREGVWIDGIRIDGFNTHLYECINDKFITKNSTKGLLIIDNGTQIDIWLDDTAYNSIKNNNNCLKIDTFVNGKIEETNYPITFDGQKSLIDAVNDITDLNAIVSLTFKVDEWYYSGGLRTSTTIDGDITVDTRIENEIKVTGVNIGSYKDGVSIIAGTSVEQILRNILTNKIGVKISKPKLTMSLTNSGPFEVGESVEGTINVSYQDGQFIGETGYDYTLAAGCSTPENYTYIMKKDSEEEILENNSYNIPSISEGTTTFTVTGTYGQSTNTPVDNTGEELNDIKINSETISTSKEIKAYYKYFYGYIEYDSDLSEITDESLDNLSSNHLNNNSITISSLKSSNDNPSIFIILPIDWEIRSTTNSLGIVITGTELNDLWKITKVITRKINDKEYNLYVNNLQQPIEYKNIIIKKKNK
jgi:hypothetical protein